MQNFNRLFFTSFIFAFLILLSGFSYSQVHYYTNLVMSGSKENPPNSSAGKGIFNGWYDEGTMMLGFTVEFSGLSGNTTMAHFHGPAVPDSNTGVQIGWTGFPTGVTEGSFSDTVMLDATQQSQLLAGLWYANIHTSEFGPGEIRTQLFETSPYHAFINLNMSGDNENPPVSTTGTGTFSGVYNQITNEFIFMVEFSGLSDNTTAAHFHGPAPADSNTGVQIGWTGFPTGITSGAFSDTVTLTEEQENQLLAGRWYANIHTAAHMGGEIRTQLYENPNVDGNLSDPSYKVIASKLNSNSGFGPDSDVRRILYYADINSSVLYLGIEGKMNTAAADGIGLFLGFDELTGAAAGTSLGGSPGGHFTSGNGGTNPDFKADFEVDYMFAINPGSTTTDVFFDGVKLVGARTGQYLGQTDQSGTPAPNINSDFFSEGSVWFAFNNNGELIHGLEVAIPFSELGVTPGGQLSAFASIVSSTAFFSDVTVPGNITGGNPGFDADFSTLAGGPFNSGSFTIPVELVSFTASVSGKTVTLNWETATELNNSGFEVQRSSDNKNWSAIAFVEGKGTVSSPSEYSYADNSVSAGKYYYRLKQIDYNGAYEFSNTAEVYIGIPGGFVLEQNYPNPFNPSTKIKFGFDKNTKAELTVYDVLGNKIADLYNGNAESGKIYEVDFDASALSSGVYYYRLSGDDRSEIKKMIFLK